VLRNYLHEQAAQDELASGVQVQPVRCHDVFVLRVDGLRQVGDLQPPAWIFGPDRSLRRPWFASQLAALRGVLLHESPAPFRSRNLFVSENALSRA